MNGTVILDGRGLNTADVLRVARERADVQLSATALERAGAGRRVIEAAHADGQPVYGLTTGLGSKVNHRLSTAEAAMFHHQVVEGRAMAVGEPMPTEAVRAAMLVRAATMATGGSGVSPEVMVALVALLNAGVHPIIPSLGSVGAADLLPMAHLALPLLGLGEAEIAGQRLPGAQALARAGLAPVAFGPKDGLSLCSSSALTAGFSALVLTDLEIIMDAADAAAALTMEGFRANPSPLDPRAQRARPAPGQAAAAARLRALLDGSMLFEPGVPRRLQDPLSIRCTAQIHGAARAALGFVRTAVQDELAGVGDNPLVLPEENTILHTGNFHTPALTLAFDLAGLAASQCVTAIAQRTMRLLSHQLTGLPDLLSPVGGASAGFGPLMKTLQSVAAEIRHLAAPAAAQALDATPIEDCATWSLLAVRKTADMAPRLRYAVAVELIVAAQAVELRQPERLGRGAGAALAVVRETVAPLTRDRSMAGDVEAVATLIAAGRFSVLV